MANLKILLTEQLHEAQAKYTYFLLAVAASAIALAIKRTTGMPLDWQQIPLGIAVLCWGVSFFAGCRNRAYFSSTIYANVALLQLQDGTHPNIPDHPQLVQAAAEGVRLAANENSSSANFWGHVQFRSLVLGGLLFLIWHIIEMTNNAPLFN